MGEKRMIAGCLVLREAPAHEQAHHKVVLCEIPAAPEDQKAADRYIVWYIDHNDRPCGARFFKDRAAAQAEFERRT